MEKKEQQKGAGKENPEKKNASIIPLLLHEKPAGIILKLRESKVKYASKLSKEVDCTYTHTLKILSELERHGLVEFSKEGRIKEVRLTETGEDVAHELEGLIRQLEKIGVSDGGEKEKTPADKEEPTDLERENEQ